jgi:shikimate kinase
VKKKVSKKSPIRKKAGGVIDRIVPVSEWEGSGIKINLYGRNGTGKTTIACTFPKPLLLVGFEDGTKSIKTVEGVDFLRVENTNELRDLTEHAGKNYATIVVDTATSLQDQILKELLGLDDLPVVLGWGTVSREQYYRRAEKTREFLRLFLELPINVVILAQEKDHTKKEEVSGDEEVLAPFIASNLGYTTCGWLHDHCDYICQCLIRGRTKENIITVGKGKKTRRVKTKVRVEGSEYCLRTLVHPLYACKLRVDRNTKIPDVIVDPTFDKINQLIQGG